MLPKFIYQFNKGPRKKEDIDDPVEAGNCRLAIQLYFYKIHNFFIKPEDILCPKSYKKTGRFILKENEIDSSFINKIKKGNVIYAQKIKNKDGSLARKDIDDFDNENDWIISLHTAIYFKDNIAWHATALEGKTAYWDINKFLEYYKPVAIKKFLE